MKFPRSTAAGVFPANFFTMEKILSIFIDESGDFGKFDKRTPYYLVTMLFHDQSKSISNELKKLDGHLTASGIGAHCLHTAPLIRREDVYENLTIDERKRILNSFMNFADKIPFTYGVSVVKKEESMDEAQLVWALTEKIRDFVEAHATFFNEFNKLIVYYDGGQKQVTGIIKPLFSDFLVDFRQKIRPVKYRLLQIADLVATFELIELKRQQTISSVSERGFFGSMREFHKDYYKRLARKKLI